MSKENFDDEENKTNQDDNTQEKIDDFDDDECQDFDEKKLREDLEKLDKELNDKDIDEFMEKMQKLVEDVSNQYGVDPNKVKVMAVPKPKFTFLSILIYSLVILVFDFVLIVAFSAIFNWVSYNHISKLLFFGLMFAGIEIVLKVASIPQFKLKKTNIFLISAIKVLPFIITATICGIWPIFVHIESFYLYILICLIIYTARKFYSSYFLEKQMKKIFKKGTKRKINKIGKKNKKKN